jgi:hypothetical protein
MQVERIKFERTGGFAGMTISRDLKLDELSDEQANTIKELLDDMDFRELPEQMLDDSGPDQFTYVITVETQKWEHGGHGRCVCTRKDAGAVAGAQPVGKDSQKTIAARKCGGACKSCSTVTLRARHYWSRSMAISRHPG